MKRPAIDPEHTPGHVLDEPGEERLLGEISVVVLQKLGGGLHELHGHELEALVLEPLDDLSADAAMDGVRLDHDEGSLGIAGHFVLYKVCNKVICDIKHQFYLLHPSV